MNFGRSLQYPIMKNPAMSTEAAILLISAIFLGFTFFTFSKVRCYKKATWECAKKNQIKIKTWVNPTQPLQHFFMS